MDSRPIVLLTGAYGFIGHHMLNLLNSKNITTVCLDSLTPAAINFPGYTEKTKFFDSLGNRFYNIDLNENLDVIFKEQKITHILHMAAESHVDNSIKDPNIFAKTNIMGTLNILNYALKYKCKLVLVSTDEVYGSSKEDIPPFSVNSILNPSSPYSASKASAELLALSYKNTFGLDLKITRCVNNFGLGQHPEKFLPKLINCAKYDTPFPLYGEGNNVRQWISAKFHCEWLLFILLNSYNPEQTIINIGSSLSMSNMQMISFVKKTLDKNILRLNLIPDRKGHDFMYKITNDSQNISKETILSELREYILSEYAVT